MPSRWSPLSILSRNIVARVIVYYAALATLASATWHLLPQTPTSFGGEMMGAIFGSSAEIADKGHAARAAQMVEPGAVAAAVVAEMLAAFLLALPLAWIYMLTRAKKGYRQSVVHTLVLMPVVVAGVVVLVKNSLALAFSLAGIVAAVRFRNTLDDSKDAVYIFVATAIGLAAGVQLEAAAAMSIAFNAVVLVLWYTEFARTAPGLEGQRAQKQMERALAIANRTGAFVAKMDREILDAMAPEQLAALEDRVRKRRKGTDTDPSMGTKPKFETTLVVRVGDAVSARHVLDGVFEEMTKRWTLDTERGGGDGTAELVYQVKMRRGISPESLAEAVRDRGTPHVLTVEIS